MTREYNKGADWYRRRAAQLRSRAERLATDEWVRIDAMLAESRDLSERAFEMIEKLPGRLSTLRGQAIRAEQEAAALEPRKSKPLF